MPAFSSGLQYCSHSAGFDERSVSQGVLWLWAMDPLPLWLRARANAMHNFQTGYQLKFSARPPSTRAAGTRG